MSSKLQETGMSTVVIDILLLDEDNPAASLQWSPQRIADKLSEIDPDDLDDVIACLTEHQERRRVMRGLGDLKAGGGGWISGPSTNT